MTHGCRDARFADQAKQETAAVLENVPIARDTYRLRVAAPAIAAGIAPGQFVMLRLAGYDDPLLGRPLALYDTVVAASSDGKAEATGLDVVYLVQGKLTTRLARFRPGQEVELWGPLGNGFEPVTADHLVMVAGGIGQTPFLALAQESLGLRRYGRPSAAGNHPVIASPAAASAVIASPVAASAVAASAGRKTRRVTLCYGARSADLLAGLDDFARAGVELLLSTDDGSRGHHGYVTDLLARVLDESPHCQIAACGPEPMLAAVARIAAQRGAPCEVSLETPMACGVGICFSCVARVKDAGPAGWDYRRTCVEGPVFDAASIVW